MMKLTAISLFFQRFFSRLFRLFTPPSRRRSLDYVVGFGTSTVAAHHPCKVSVIPAVAFRPERLIVPSTIAKHFRVANIEVNGVRQLRSVGSVPALMFTERMYGPHLLILKMDVATPNDFVSVTLVNDSDVEQVFQCGMSGPMV
jgi:hypothetical protein